MLQNILSHHYKGKLYAVNPKESTVQGVPCFHDCSEVPQADLAIIAIAAPYVEEAVRILAAEKNCKAFILFSAGFGETGEEGRRLELRLKEIADHASASLLGPNCIGMITGSYKGVFAGPIPAYHPQGCDLVSASGATMVFLLEMAIPRGLKFRDLFSVGNSAQISVEDVLQYWDDHFDPHQSSRVKLLYMEQITDPKRFLHHARSLVKKGCRIAAIKAGSTEAGSRAVSSHTGALAGPDAAVSALFRKAGVIRCYSRVELIYVAAIFSIPPLRGDRLAVITHAGGPGVMLTDILVKGGMKVPSLSGPEADALLARLHPGSSVSNPIDFLATGTAKQLGEILDYVDNAEETDGSVVVFGTTGMWQVDDVYKVLHEKMSACKKPIYPILPSMIQAAREVHEFQELGHVNFTDEVSFGYVLTRINRLAPPYDDPFLPEPDLETVNKIYYRNNSGWLPPDEVEKLLQAASIPMVKQRLASSFSKACEAAEELGFPLVMKADGLLHKSDAGGVVMDILHIEQAKQVYQHLMLIEGAQGVILQQQLSGVEIIAGLRKDEKFGHQLLIGLGGIFVEVFKDVSVGLAPVGKKEALSMIRHLRSYPLIKGVRGRQGVSEDALAELIVKLSALVEAAPWIAEMDINPLMGKDDQIIGVDARILVAEVVGIPSMPETVQ